MKRVREDFEFFSKRPELVYLDNSCVTLKPRVVTEAMLEYYESFPGCAGRSAHQVAKQVDRAIASARTEVRKLLRAKHDEEIVFTRNTTEAINIVARGLDINGKRVLTSDKEHNSNLVPWLAAAERGAQHTSVPTIDGVLDLEALERELEKGDVALVAINHISNLDGVENDIKQIARLAHSHGALILVDGAQAAGHIPVDVRKLDVDFYAISGHKMCGPSGTGALYGKKELLEQLSPGVLGGHTVVDAFQDRYELAGVPERFEAGLQDYAGIIGFGQAARYVRKFGEKNILRRSSELAERLRGGLPAGLELLGDGGGSIVTVIAPRMDAHELAGMLDRQGVLVRAGAFCVHSWFNTHDKRAAVRFSPYFYNSEEDVDQALATLEQLESLL